jgi:hypothetical protein
MGKLIMKTRITQLAITIIFSILFFELFSQDTLSGNIVYDNDEKTPLPYSTALLLDNEGKVIASAQTNENGEYRLPFDTTGSFILTANTNLPWGDVSISDVYKIILHINDSISLDSLQKLAADVDGNDTINQEDVDLIMDRLLNITNSFPVGDWIFQKKEINIISDGTGLNVEFINGDSEEIKGRKTGDEEGEEQPGWQDRINSIRIKRTDILNITNNDIIKIPIKPEQPIACAAFTLNFFIPDNLEIEGIESDFNISYHNIHSRLVHVSHISQNLQAINLKKDQPILYLIVKIKNRDKGFSSNIELTGGSEFADIKANSIYNLSLSIPTIKNNNANSISFETIYPNPIKSITKIKYTIFNKGEISISIYDPTGKTCVEIDLGKQQIGDYKQEIDCSDLKPGNYLLILTNRNNTHSTIETKKIIKL